MKEPIKIINYEDFRKKLKKFIVNDEELQEIDKAYLFAKEKHKDKKRATNEDYINHPLSVADILADLNVDSITIIAALLHETINHGNTTKEELEENFSKEVADIVDTVSKINKLILTNDSENSAIYLRKVLVGLSQDVRVLFIKLADRLHNMRTIWAISPEAQKNKIHETQSVLIPIAHRLGINSIKSELEDLCLKYSKPDVYQDVLDELNASKEELNNYLLEMQDSISQILTDHGLKFEIKGRVKSVHSIYHKLSSGRKFSDIHDILALRVFVDQESDCYLVIGLIHSKYRPVPGRFKDYIAMPKENMYQSLHTTVFGRNGYHFEVQVRTHEMDEIAEKGMAAHWSYKEKGTVKIQKMMEQKLEMFRNLIEANNEGSDLEFASKINTEFLDKMIYVYTPKGDVVELPSGATPIDFAYRIHSDVGDKTVGAIVNEKIVPLDKPLNDGDIVSIKTNNNSKPSLEWLKFVKTTHAKNKIKAFFSKQDKDLYIEKGKTILEKEIRRKKLVNSEVLSEEHLNKILSDLKLNDIDELYLNIGSLRYTPSYIINLINQDKKNVSDLLLDKVRNKNDNKIIDYKNDIIVANTPNIKVNIAKCCKPIMGDKIVGYVTKGEGVTVHKSDCKNIDNTDRLIDVSWNTNSDKFYLTDLKITSLSTKNALLDIITKASYRNVYVETIKNHDYDALTIFDLTLKIKNIDTLNNFINDLEMLPFTKEVKRISK